MGVGLIGAIVLAYLLIVVNFPIRLDPSHHHGVAGSAGGICWMLLITHIR